MSLTINKSDNGVQGNNGIITITCIRLCHFSYQFYSSVTLFLDLDGFAAIVQVIVPFLGMS